MSLVLYGTAAGEGYAIGRVHLMSSGLEEVPHYPLEEGQIEKEVARYQKAVEETKNNFQALRCNLPPEAPVELNAFLSFHLMMLSDISLAYAPTETIRQQKINAEWALRQEMLKLSAQFDAMEDAYLKTRKEDLIQVIERIYHALVGLPRVREEIKGACEEAVVLIASDISPADAVLFSENQVAAFATDFGGPTSHTAIFAKALAIPSVLGLQKARELIQENEWIIVDGVQGALIIDPDPVILQEYRLKIEHYKQEKRKLDRVRRLSARTEDGTPITILANIEKSSEISEANRLGAHGIGLFRSEFLFLNQEKMPSEEEQYRLYSKLIKKNNKKPFTIRTVDMGVDKNPRWLEQWDEVLNPAMSLTGIRLSLSEPVLFRSQIRAILRAATYGKVALMWPMITSLTELKQCFAHLSLAKEELRERKEKFAEKIPVGIMIETPAAALAINTLIKHVDFISIGTNDLIQYTLAVDRGDDLVNYLYQPAHPTILKLLHQILKAAKSHKVPVSICGEMAADRFLTRLLLGLGLRTFSVNPASILSIKEAIVHTHLTEIAPYVRRLLRNEDPDKVEGLLSKLNGYDRLQRLR